MSDKRTRRTHIDQKRECKIASLLVVYGKKRIVTKVNRWFTVKAVYGRD